MGNAMKVYVILFVAIYVYITIRYKKYKNPYKLYMIFGKKGSGKSTLLVKYAITYQKKGYTIYTNMDDLDISGVRYIDPKDLGKFVPEENSVVLLDEVGMLYDNRNYKDFKPEVRDFFKLQRHYKCIVYLASQSFDIDKKLRDLTDSMILVTSIGGILSCARPITKKITLVEASSYGESRIADNLKFRIFLSWQWTWIPKYAKYFKSYLLPEHQYIKYKENTSPMREHIRSRAKLKNLFQRKSRPEAGEVGEKF